MNLIDSAWFYGPHAANRLIAETLHPYAKGLVIGRSSEGDGRPTRAGGSSSLISISRRSCGNRAQESLFRHCVSSRPVLRR